MISRLIIGFLAGIALLAFAAPASAEERYGYTALQIKGINFLAQTYHQKLVSSGLAINSYGRTDCTPDWFIDGQRFAHRDVGPSFTVKETGSTIVLSYRQKWCAAAVSDKTVEVLPGDVIQPSGVRRFDQLYIDEICSFMNGLNPQWMPQITYNSCTTGPPVYKRLIFGVPGNGVWVYHSSWAPGSVLAFQPELPESPQEPIGLMPKVE